MVTHLVMWKLKDRSPENARRVQALLLGMKGRIPGVDITAGSFVTGVEELHGAAVAFHPGGAVAAASIFYLLLAVAMGLG